jgi:hypothetical protein
VTAQRELSFDTALSRQIVHKRALEEVLLCDSAPNGPDGLLCAAQLPRAHRFYNPEGVGLYDFMLLLEPVTDDDRGLPDQLEQEHEVVQPHALRVV